MKKIAIYSLLCFLLFSSSCKKDKPGTADDEQGDYFTCYVNGEYWEAYSDAAGPQSGSPVYAEKDNEFLTLNVSRLLGSFYHQKMFLIIKNVSALDTYPFYVEHDEVVGFRYYDNCDKYYYDSLNPGSFNLTYWDQQEHRMKGTFSMTLRNPDCPDSLLYITNGKFSFFYY